MKRTSDYTAIHDALDLAAESGERVRISDNLGFSHEGEIYTNGHSLFFWKDRGARITTASISRIEVEGVTLYEAADAPAPRELPAPSEEVERPTAREVAEGLSRDDYRPFNRAVETATTLFGRPIREARDLSTEEVEARRKWNYHVSKYGIGGRGKRRARA